jgi:hypothetical protein
MLIKNLWQSLKYDAEIKDEYGYIDINMDYLMMLLDNSAKNAVY